MSLHWDFVCDRLTGEQARLLYGVSARALAAVNAYGTFAAAVS